MANDDEDGRVVRNVVWGGSQAPYVCCSHQGCSKKADPRVTSHDCCGTATRFASASWCCTFISNEMATGGFQPSPDRIIQGTPLKQQRTLKAEPP